MKKHLFWHFFVLVSLLLTACSEDRSLGRMEQIKAIGDSDPQMALSMLDSLEIEVRDKSDYIKSKYDLLRIRLNDKAYKLPTSDIMIKKLVTFFEANGSDADKQEVQYYAGSVYRDLQDTPRALEHFFKSLDYANANPGKCDSVMLCNTYSNINYLEYKVQNYGESLKAAIKELEICKKTNTDPSITFSHLGASYQALKKYKEAEIAYDSVYSRIVQSKTEMKYQDLLVLLLYHYSELKAMSKAKDCIKLIKGNPLEGTPTNTCLAMGEYYRTLGMVDSAAVYFLWRVAESRYQGVGNM